MSAAKREAGGGGAEERNAGVSQAGYRDRSLGTGQWRMGMSPVELAGLRCVQACHPLTPVL